MQCDSYRSKKKVKCNLLNGLDLLTTKKQS